MDRAIPGHRIVSDGSAGFPFDRDLRPSYLLLDDERGPLRIEARRVRYEVEAAVRDLAAGQVPFAQVIAFQMRHATLMPKHETDYARRDMVTFAE